MSYLNNFSNNGISNNYKVSYNFKCYLERIINQLTNKNELFEILYIIEQNNSDLQFDNTEHILCIDFNNLSKQTYIQINEFINNINQLSNNIKYVPYNNNTSTSTIYNIEEKTLLNHIKYIKHIKNNQKNKTFGKVL